MFEDSDDAEEEPYKKEEGAEAKPSNKKIEVFLPKITSGIADPYLARVIAVAYIALTHKTKGMNQKIQLEENRYNTTFVYYFENKRLGLFGYVGRDKKTNSLTYVVMDSSRFKWAILEGFVIPNQDGVLDVKAREYVFNKIGVFRSVKTINDFVAFMSGTKGYKFKGDYFLSDTN